MRGRWGSRVDYIRIRNWDRYQHYSRRDPPWIKLYHKLLDDYDYGCLQDASKLLLMTLYMLASRTGNNIPADPEWIKSKGMLKGKVDIKPLIKCNYIEYVADCKQDASNMIAQCKQDASNMIAQCKQDATPETETETETEKKKKPPPLPKTKYLDSVFLTEPEYKKLQEALGQKSLDVGIEKLDYSITVKGGKYRDHYKTLLNWHKRGYLEENGHGGPNPGRRFDKHKNWQEREIDDMAARANALLRRGEP